jgi:hypothetical protein
MNFAKVDNPGDHFKMHPLQLKMQQLVVLP